MKGAYFVRRGAALAADAALLLLLAAILADVLLAVLPGQGQSQGQGHGPSAALAAIAVVFVPLWLATRVLLESRLGFTPGKLLAGLRVVDRASGQPPTPRQALVRTLLRPVDGFPALYLVGALAAALHRENARLGDSLAGTRVVRAGARRGFPLPTTSSRDSSRAPRRASAGSDPRGAPAAPLAREGHRGISAELAGLVAGEANPYHVFDRGDVFLVVGPAGLCVVRAEHAPGLLVVDEDGHRLLLDGREQVPDPLGRMRAALVEADRRLAVLLRPSRPGAAARTIHEALGPEGHDWLLCYTHAHIPDRLSAGVLRRHVVALEDLAARITSARPLFADPRRVAELAAAVGAAYDAKPYAAPETGGAAEAGGHEKEAQLP